MRQEHIVSVLVIAFSSTVHALPWSALGLQALGRRADGIIFESNPPKLGEKLPYFLLGSVSPFPTSRFKDIVKASVGPDGKVELRKDESGGYAYYEGDNLIGSYDSVVGETTVLPKLDILSPFTSEDATFDPSMMNTLAKEIIVPDSTRYSIVIGSKLSGSRQDIGKPPQAPATYLVEGVIRREIDYQTQRYPVCGPGSQGSFNFASDGKIKGMSHVWRAGQLQGTSIAPISPDNMKKLILTQLDTAKITSANVQSIDLCFYDSGAKYIQPVVRFTVNVTTPLDHANKLIMGYIPAGGKELEPLPAFYEPLGKDEEMPINATTVTSREVTDLQSRGTRVTIGRYIMSGDRYSEEFVKDANKLWNGIVSAGGSGGTSPVNSQYYWDDPQVYQYPSTYSYLNAVNLGFSDGHGSPWSFLTNGALPDRGVMSIPKSLSKDGFGPGSGGQLAYWILMACEAIPAPIDFRAGEGYKAFDPWWQVFNGMHSVVGYRTNSLIDPGKMTKVGKWLGQGASVVTGVMQVMKELGKVSAVTVCGHGTDHMGQLANLGRPSCLQMWWYA
jgi:hypothetical protein